MELAIGQTIHQPTKQARDEPSVLARLRARDIAALDRLTLDYGAALTRAAWLVLGDAHAAADLAQEALIAAWDGAGRTDEATELRPWLFGILFNLGRKQLRTLARRRKREENAARSEAGSTMGEDERLQGLRRALATLDEDERQLIVLRYEQDFSVAETARALGVPEGTVKSRTHAAVEKLRKMMKQGQER